MPSFPGIKLSKSRQSEKEQLAGSAMQPSPPVYAAPTGETSSATPSFANQAPPSYTATDGSPNPLPPGQLNEKGVAESDIAWAFSDLDIKASEDGFPSPESCLAHLKLLEAFFALKAETAYTNGAFGLFDSRAPGSEESAAGNEQATRKRLEALAQIREKRWALYVARAVDRFEVWWTTVLTPMNKSFGKGAGVARLKTTDLPSLDSWKYFVDDSKSDKKSNPWVSSRDTLPPLDVLMVWHSFMLNPRNYLEDCRRFGLRDTWRSGMPWNAVNDSIDDNFQYEVTQNAKDRWISMTGRPWDNLDEASEKTIRCPRCTDPVNIPWTTATIPEFTHKDWDMEFAGQGYAERDLSMSCPGCKLEVTHDILRVAKFRKDAGDLLFHDYPMGGTVVPGKKGTPHTVRDRSSERLPQSFPNRLIKDHLRVPILELCKNGHGSPEAAKSSMLDVKDMIEKSVKDISIVARINGYKSVGRLYPDERLAIRHMMSRYWDNHSLFSMELSGAVMRQASFVDKMHKIDWLHSPTALTTMQRLLVKYERFFFIMAMNPGKMAVPTLDVDLAWHTHQLSPKDYYAYSLRKTRDRFIDHDDKIDEDSLSGGFEWTSKEYEKRFGAVYSECTCWYCEAIRAKHPPALSGLFSSKHDKIADAFHASGAATLCPPDNSAHISAHNAVPTAADPFAQAVANRLAASRRRQLDQAYERACKRAIKRGRPVPKKEQFVADHYGVAHASAYPYGMLYMTPMMYPYGMFMLPVGVGMYGACAAGTCSGGGAGGGCGGGGCGGGGGGGGCGGGCGGGSSACGGGSGGGGGGCGGGGGGGGGCGGGGGGGGGCGGGGC